MTEEPGWTAMFDIAKSKVADGRVLLGIVVVALMFDTAVRSGFVSVGGALLALITPVALIASGRFRRIESMAFLIAVPFFGIWLAVRSSLWLVVADVLAAALLLLMAASFARNGSLFDVNIPGLFVRACAACLHLVYAGPFFIRGLTSQKRGHLGPVVRGLLLITPVVIVLGALLASADKVFASLFDFGDLPQHIILIAIGAWLVTVLYSMASLDAPVAGNSSHRLLGATEALVALGAVVALFAAFVITQIIVLSGGAKHVLETEGLTYAEHARQGFFQLIAVAVITLAVLMTLHAITRTESKAQRAWFTGLSEAAVVLTLAIVVSAIARLGLYEDAYGLTMLRLYATVFAGWVGVVFVFLGVSIAGVGATRHWFTGTSIAAGLVVVFALNIVNPERLVVERNYEHARTSSVPFDVNYNTGLSTDAFGALSSGFYKLDDAQSTTLRMLACKEDESDFKGWLAYNLSRDIAKTDRAIDCQVPAR